MTLNDRHTLAFSGLGAPCTFVTMGTLQRVWTSATTGGPDAAAADVRVASDVGAAPDVGGSSDPCALGVRATATTPLITDFSSVGGAADGGGSGLTIFEYPTTGATAVNVDTSLGTLHATGVASSIVSLVGVVLPSCTDASRYSGVSFTMSGGVGPSGMVAVNIGTGPDECSGAGCGSPNRNVAVTSTPTLIKLAWSDFTGGSPLSSPDPTQIVDIVWAVPPVTSTFNFDLTIDDLQFY
jgi:hypothetical protein